MIKAWLFLFKIKKYNKILPIHVDLRMIDNNERMWVYGRVNLRE